MALIKEKANKDNVVGNYWRIGPVSMDLCKQNSLRDAVRVPRICIGLYLFASKAACLARNAPIHEEFYTLSGDDLYPSNGGSFTNPVNYAYAIVKDKIPFFSDAEDDV